jgi:solute carrier family 35 protein F5
VYTWGMNLTKSGWVEGSRAMSVVWTNPLVATLGMSLTIPLAMLADMVVHARHYSFVYILGSVQVFVGFVIANLTDICSQKMGL